MCSLRPQEGCPQFREKFGIMNLYKTADRYENGRRFCSLGAIKGLWQSKGKAVDKAD